jgi:hypothetical protein
VKENLSGICHGCKFNPLTGSKPDGCRIGRTGVEAIVRRCPKHVRDRKAKSKLEVSK